MQTVTPEQQVRWNAIIIETLGVFIEICKANGLRYFCVGGTAIGAVRHKGMIPWDDDIDVCMPRPDYERLIGLFREEDYPGYELVAPYDRTDYPLPSLKFCNKNTTLVEDSVIPCVTGLYIDILPVDGTSDDREEALRLFHRYHKIKNRLNAISRRYSFAGYLKLLGDRKEWGQFVYKTIGFCCRKTYRRYLIRRLRDISFKFPFDEATNVLVYSGSYGEREVYPKAWIREVVELPFEGLQVALPKEYDAYLYNIFGDYMQLPPEEKRVAKHQKAYFNMEKRETLEEIKAKLK